MHLSKRSALIYLLWICTVPLCLCQSTNYRYQYITDESGLSNSTVESIVQDSVGYLWFGTKYGLNRFDGYRIKTYLRHQQDSSSILHNGVGNLYVGRDGTLWMLCWEGVSRYVPEKDHFKHYIPENQTTVKPINNHMVHADEDAEGNLWVVNSTGQLFKYLKAEDRFEYIPTTNPKDIHVSCFQFDDKEPNVIWMGYTNGLLKYNLGESLFDFFPIDSLNQSFNNNIHNILIDGPYLFLAVYESGIHRFDRRTMTYKAYPFEDRIDNLVLDGFKDRQQRIWISSTRGLFLYNRQLDIFERFGTYGEGHIPEPTIRSICTDKQHNLWLGTAHNGIVAITQEKMFLHIGNKKSLNRQNVSTITSDHRNNIWVGYNSGLDILDTNMNLVYDFHSKHSTQPIADEGVIWKIHQDRAKNIWLATHLGGLHRYIPATNSFENINDLLGHTQEELLTDVRYIDEDSEGNLWLTVHGNGIAKFNPKSLSLTKYDASHPLVTQNWTNSLIVDHEDNIWVGSFTGLLKIANHGRSSVTLTEIPEDSTSLSNKIVRSLFIDRAKRLWVGTSEGLNLYQPKQKNFRRLMLDDGLPNGQIASIIEDDRGYLWLGTKGGGLVKFDKERWIKGKAQAQYLWVFDKSDGLHTNHFMDNSVYKRQDGYLFFGGVKGVTYFHPDSIILNNYKPPVVIDEVKLFNDASLARQVGFQRENGSITSLELNYDQDVVTFGFSAFNYIHPQQNRYAYKMEGFDQSWYDVGNKREATYTNLPPGQYRFLVKAANNDHIWNDTPAVLNLTITPPWWNTKLFRTGLVFCILGLMYALFWVRTKNIILQKGKLEKLVNEKTQEIAAQYQKLQKMATKIHEADEAKIKFYMNVSHELKTPLALILGPIDNLLKTPKLDHQTKRQYGYIQRNAMRLMRLINELLDLRKLEVGDKMLRVAQGDIIGKSKQIFELFSFFAESRPINYEFSGPTATQGLPVAWYDQSILEKVLYNLLSNAFYHTSEGSVRLSVAFSDDKKHFFATVEDTGTGIPKKHLEHIFTRFFSNRKAIGQSEGTGIGLTLCKELLTLHGGQITVSSEEGKGTSFTFQIPIEQPELGSYTPFQGSAGLTPVKYPQFGTSVGTNSVANVEQKAYTVLVVEDNDDFRHYLIDCLQDTYQVVAARHGKEALEMLGKHAIDLIVSDMMMPHLDGIGLCQKVKSHDEYSHLPIILLTAKTSSESRTESYDVGADAFLTKPFDTTVLIARIGNLIKSRQQLQEAFRLYNAQGQNDITASKEKPLLHKMIKIVEDNIENPNLGYQDFVEALGMSKTQLYRKARELTGQSINLFIRSIRLQYALKLLQDPTLNITEVSYQVGFNDPNYFSKCFKQEFNQSPKAYMETFK